MPNSGVAQDAAQFGSFRSRAATHPGTAGRMNEDGYLNRPDLGLWVVADGAGGHQSGEVASAEVVAALQDITVGLSAGEMLQEVRGRLEAAHEKLRTVSEQRGQGIMATTVVVLIARDDHFACLWAGDSPAYLLRGDVLTKITRDHSLVQDLVESGIITEAEAVNHRQANIITRAVGADQESLELDKRTGPLMPGDRLLLCSDGLSKTLSAGEIAELLSLEDGADAERLVTAAIDARAIDNVTAITIQLDDDDPSTTVEVDDPSTTVEVHKPRDPATPAAPTNGAPADGAPRPVTE
jgi:protein phosphatase/serine/threonine-protein phosphatase Stp1